MSDRPSATIIAFPQLASVASAHPPAEDPQARLTRALAALERALADQRAALTGWRDSLGTLQGTMRGLGQSLGGYQSGLARLGDEVAGANRQARRLETWADGALTTPPAEH